MNFGRNGDFRFEILIAVGIKFSALWDVTPYISFERRHVSKHSYIFIFGFIILHYGDI
jgi:hypothetical protein